ncbi:DUF4124 domain-containing protein [Lysobacter sp. S4-A87]|uniref:DUF4124 domain-containing protein n=1 Tax=Lysobacter sp. S4-A87 TaxID=2925843 RepID=UPI001F533E4C|nr:DUF4124 domain-containing protein [Lysobacter sp. S4-A87]UNK48507.1 DUF4124 domain-containing protein [Lysobacter sp. S4-A87]
MRLAVGGDGARRRLPWLLLLLALAPHAQAQVAIYRCTDASGAVTLQNGVPCPKGSTEVKRVVEPAPQQSRAQFLSTGAAPAPAPAATRAAPAAPASAPASATAASAPPLPERGGRTAPPPLFECRTWEGHRYLGDDAQPPPRCVPLAVTGLDGSNGGTGTACQMVDDQCQPVPDALLCQGWTQRLGDVESQSVGGADNRAYAQAEATRLRAIIAGSTCAPP